MGVSSPAIHKAIHKLIGPIPVSILKEQMPEIMLGKIGLALNSLTEKKLKRAPVSQIQQVIDGNYKILRLETGQSTDNIVHADLVKAWELAKRDLAAEEIARDADDHNADSYTQDAKSLIDSTSDSE